MIEEKLLSIYAHSFQDNWELPALTNYTTKKTLTYGNFACEIAKMHVFFRQCGIKRGDRVALMGKNTPEWIVVFFATITYGATIVPILQDFNPNDAQHIINHSDSTMLFIDPAIWETFELERLPLLRGVISLVDGKLLAEHNPEEGRVAKALKGNMRKFRQTYPKGYSSREVRYPDMERDDLAVINYTSGTTGFSKGVMLTYNNLCGNVVYGIQSRLHYQGSRALSFLPLAHAYGCAFDMLAPLAVGSHVTLFGRLPSPMLLLKAMAEVKPHLVICVPLILEKIYRKQILPMITKNAVRWVRAIPFLDKALYVMIRKKLVDAFGGEFEEVIVGGAPLNHEVEEFLHLIKFPFTVGYGMT
ncbi:MAG: AMP-binding protein, partial [Muribaculaceae bacterium]|nr:AMP-binding protein [Muribaculaceae bacterium]